MKNWSGGVLALLMLMLSWPCWAEPSQRELEDIQIWEAAHLAAEQTIPALLERYGNAIGCGFSFNPGNVVKYRIQKQSVFVAAISLDVGCSGGQLNGQNPAGDDEVRRLPQDLRRPGTFQAIPDAHGLSQAPGTALCGERRDPVLGFQARLDEGRAVLRNPAGKGQGFVQ
ncbi:hypothetical protein [Metapseudomonas otitidis]|uniref:hypothetical protein n=1 Tax=Metapseudomonas otitidis TaxID=319939 RepID=UPI00280B3FF6|nr:hypothetical protein [Pseudomonas otitidis]